MPALPEDIVQSFAEFKASELEQFHVWLRRQRVRQLRTLLAQPEALTLEAFNQEVWRVETATYLRGAQLPRGELLEKPLDSHRIADLKAALAARATRQLLVGLGRTSFRRVPDSLDFLYSFTSENVGGVGRDARHIAKHIASRS
jgi:hypothetical protein